MLANTLVALLFLAAGITAYPSTIKREDTIDDGEIQLYAYGAGISGLQVYGGPDGESCDVVTSPFPDIKITPPPPKRIKEKRKYRPGIACRSPLNSSIPTNARQ